jgi:acetyl-CoA C-acetyltransferase
MKDCVIVSACRTAVGAFGGSLKDVSCPTVGSIVMQEAVRRAGIDPGLIDDVRFGCCMEPEDALNVTRVSALMARIPETITAVTVNRVCISGMEAVISGMAMIQATWQTRAAAAWKHMYGFAYSLPAARWGCRLQTRFWWTTSSTAANAGPPSCPDWSRALSRRGGSLSSSGA